MEEQIPDELYILSMLKYASRTFKNVNPSFFEGIGELSEKIGKYLILKDYYQIEDLPKSKESIEYWKLQENDTEKDKNQNPAEEQNAKKKIVFFDPIPPEERVTTNHPWAEKLIFGGIANLDPESDYLPYGVSKKDESKELIWKHGWASINTNRKKLARNFQIENIPNLVEEFYSSISKMYGEMAHNEIKNVKLAVPSEWFEGRDDYLFNMLKSKNIFSNFSLKNSRNTKIPIAGNLNAAIIMTHELMHRFNSINQDIIQDEAMSNATYLTVVEKIKNSAEYKNREKTPSFINELILSETCSILAEQLFMDFIEERYQNEEILDFLYSHRLESFIIMSKNSANYIKEIDTWLKISKQFQEKHNNETKTTETVENIEATGTSEAPETVIATQEEFNSLTEEEKKELLQFVKSISNWKFAKLWPEKFTINLIRSGFSHIFGYCYATYLHEKIINGEISKQEALEKCSKAFVLSQSDEEKQMQLLQELGAPFIKNGEFVIDDETINSFYSSVINDVERRVKKANEQSEKNKTSKINLQNIKDNVSAKDRDTEK